MPTDVLLALQRRLAARKREEHREKTALVLIALTGTALTLLEAADSEAFATALLALGMLE